MFARLVPLVFAFPAVMAAQRPPSKFEITGCTMECCGYGRSVWQAKTQTVAFVARDTASAKAFAIPKGDSVRAETGIVAMLQPGAFKARSTQTVQVHSYPKNVTLRPMTVPAGDTLYVLDVSPEATDMVVWYRGKMYWTWLDNRFDEVSLLRSQWWAKVRNNQGQVGWIADPQGLFDGPGEPC